jgi:hypothetical protein
VISPTFSETYVPRFSFNIAIYNSAGELVRLLAGDLSSPDDPAVGFKLSSPTLLPGSSDPLHVLAGGADLVWNGGNDSGQAVSGGVYYVKLEVRDPFGHVEAFSREVSVFAPATPYSIRIFNSAGELVRTLEAPANMASAPSRLDAGKGGVASLGAGISFDLGNGSSLDWDARNDSGQKVASGTYHAELLVQQQGSGTVIHSTSVAVLHSSEDFFAGAALMPNPLNSASGLKAEFRLAQGQGLALTGRLYNLAGELVLSSSNDLDPDKIILDLSGRGASSGTYVLAVTAKAPWGSTQKKVFKLALVK